LQDLTKLNNQQDIIFFGGMSMGEYDDEITRMEQALTDIKLLLDRMNFNQMQAREEMNKNFQKILEKIQE
jgi:hypothetical protein